MKLKKHFSGRPEYLRIYLGPAEIGSEVIRWPDSGIELPNARGYWPIIPLMSYFRSATTV